MRFLRYRSSAQCCVIGVRERERAVEEESRYNTAATYDTARYDTRMEIDDITCLITFNTNM